ncbi:MAG: transcriptional regulator NrdR [Planctomycetaceae bacterium]
MLCPICHHDETRVIDSRASADNTVRRRRECLKCRRRFTTYEKAEQAPLKVVKKDGGRAPFDREKIRSGIAKACHKRPVESDVIERLVADIEADVLDNFEREVPTNEIGERVSAALKNLDDVAYLRFASVYKEFQDADDFAQQLQPILRGPK